MTRQRKMSLGVYFPVDLLDYWNAYAEERGISRNKAFEEIMRKTLCPKTLDTKPEVIDQAIKNAFKEVTDGDW